MKNIPVNTVNMVRLIGTLLLLLAARNAYGQGTQATQTNEALPFRNPALSEDARIADFLGRLTIDEKIDLFGMSLNIPRLGVHMSGGVPTIPGSNGHVEAIHGVAMGGNQWAKKSPGTPENGGANPVPTTQFPQGIGLGSTWDPGLIERVASQIAKEARYIFETKDRGGVIIRAPNADLGRDPRWGRFDEIYGEDPMLVGRMATAFTRGIQGTDPKHWTGVSMLKHFIANTNEDNRHGSSSDFDERLLREYYTAPFRAAIKDANAGAYMAAFNAVNGVPMTANIPLLKTLPESWGFNGLVAIDRGAIEKMVVNHKYYPDKLRALVGAIKAGNNQLLDTYVDEMREALKKNLLTETDLDTNLRGLIRVLIRVGAFDNLPKTTKATAQQPAPWEGDAVRQLVLQATRESIVLLKNAPPSQTPKTASRAATPSDNPQSATRDPQSLLPLDPKTIKSIALLGPMADVVYADGYGGDPLYTITPLQGIKNRLGNDSQVIVRHGKQRAAAIENAKNSDIAIVFVGNYPRRQQAPKDKQGKPIGKEYDGHEGTDRQTIALRDDQEKLIKDTFAVNPRTIVVLVSQFPTALKWEQDNIPAILRITHCSQMQGTALAEVLFGDYSPSGHLTVTWPESDAQLPPMMDYNIRHGRTYMYFQGKPLYAFGHGLSYTTFQYTNLRPSATRLTPGAPLTIEVTLTNTGPRKSDEVAQFYIQHLNSSVERAQKELKDFKRVTLEPGASAKVTFELSAEDVAYWDTATQNWKIEKDKIKLMAGGASDRIELQQEIEVDP